jgi:chemotaxis protein CheX
MKAEHINPFLKATMETYQTMLSIGLKPGKLVVLPREQCVAPICSVITFTGQLNGAVVMCFDKASALNSVGSLIGETLTDLNADVFDGIGELVNVVAGYAKKYMTVDITISLPSVKEGSYDAFFPKVGTVVNIPFECPLGVLTLSVAYQE